MLSPLFSDYLVNRAEVTLASLDKLQQSHVVYLGNQHGTPPFLRDQVDLSNAPFPCCDFP